MASASCCREAASFNCWSAVNWATLDLSVFLQCYGQAPLTYYDPFAVGDLAFFSSRGPTRDGRLAPYVSAPGVGIVAPLSKDAWSPGQSGYFASHFRISPSGSYATLQGTSMATPNVTGAAALLLQRSLEIGGRTTPAELKALLAGGARGDAFTGAVPNPDWGHGKVDVTASAALVVPAPNQPPVANAGPDQVLVDSDADGGEWATLDGSSSTDADGAISTYQWRDASGALVGNAARTTVRVPAASSATFTLTVTDDLGASDMDPVQVTVHVPKTTKGGKPR
jgi:subtilisin family serine protease